MKEYVLVQFIAVGDERHILSDKLENLKEDFISTGYVCIPGHSTLDAEEVFCVSGQISSEFASIIKLRDPFLSERMRISYIPEELKDKYRK